jgi:hypothetical protein
MQPLFQGWVNECPEFLKGVHEKENEPPAHGKVTMDKKVRILFE